MEIHLWRELLIPYGTYTKSWVEIQLSEEGAIKKRNCTPPSNKSAEE